LIKLPTESTVVPVPYWAMTLLLKPPLEER